MDAPTTSSGKLLPCGVCARPVPEAQFRSGVAKVIQGALFCVECVREAERARTESLAFKAQAADGQSYVCATCATPVLVEDIRAGGIVHYAGAVWCRNCSRDLKTVIASRRNAAPAAAAAPGRTSSGRLAVPPVAAPPPGRPSSARLAAVAPPPPPVEEPPAADEDDGGGRTMVFDAVLKVPPIAKPAAPATPPPPATPAGGGDDEEIGGRTMEFGAVLKMPPIAPPAAAPAEAATPVSSDPNACAKCGKAITAAETRLGHAVTIGGRTYCRRCKDSIASDEEEARRAAGRRFTCIQCARAVTAKEIVDNKIVYHQGSLYCGICARDPLAILLARQCPPTPGICRGCSAPTQGAASECAACQGRIKQMLDGSKVAAKELEKLALSYNCQGENCGATVTEQELQSHKARIHQRKVLCPKCASKVQSAVRSALPTCARCKKSLDAPSKDGFCDMCRAIAEADAADTEAAISITSQHSLKCGGCGKAIQKEDLQQGKAGSTGGKLLCPACRSKAQSGPAAPKKAEVICSTCDSPIPESPYMYAGRPFCNLCKPVFEKIIADGSISPAHPLPCSSCNKQAHGEGALKVQDKAFCAACRRQADFLVQYVVRQRRAPKRSLIPWRGTLVAGSAVAIVVALGVAVASVKGGDPEVVIPTAAQIPQAAIDAIKKANEIADRPAVTYPEAAAKVDELKKLADESRSLAEAQNTLTTNLARVVASRDGFAPTLATDAIKAAQHAWLTTNDTNDALAALAKFPAALAQTPAAQEVARARAYYEAIASCNRQAQLLLNDKDPHRWAKMDELLASREASDCEFVTTALGRQIDNERKVVRLAEENAAKPTATPPGKAEAEKAEQRHDASTAVKGWKKVLAENSFSLDALLGLARGELELEHYGQAREAIESATRLDPLNNSVRVMRAWAVFTDAESEGHERAETLLKGIPPNELGPFGRRLKAILALGKPGWEGLHLRLYVPVAISQDPEAVGILERLDRNLGIASQVFGLNAGSDRVTIINIFDNDERARFATSLEMPTLAGDGVLRGCGAVLGVNLAPDVRRNAILSLAGRCQHKLPPWILVGLPEAFENLATTTRVKFKSSAAIDRLDMTKFKNDPALVAVARFVCALALAKKDGAAALRLYIETYGPDPAKARAQLDAFLTSSG